MTMTREECIALLERYAEYDGMGIPNLAGCRETMKMAADLLSQPSLPFNLDEAAKKIVIQLHPCMEYSSVMGDRLTMGELIELVKAGAEWMAGQGYTFETIMQEDEVDELVPTCPDMYNYGYSCGDKVIVQIRKK